VVTAGGWNPERYLRYADERGRPFAELLARVDLADAGRILDLGCGPGNLTRTLRSRWPGADVLGIDSSPAMIERARADAGTEARFEVADLRTWRSYAPVDLLVTNATLQWVPGHLELLPALAAQVAPGGSFALQVPGNFAAPSHTTLYALAAEDRFASHLGDLVHPVAHDAPTYLAALQSLGFTVDAWETTYLHVLEGDDAVFTWVSATAARPVLEALPSDLRGPFEAAYRHRLRAAYPPGPQGTVLPFRRVFAVGRRTG
jgi:trans-aconitate 2-methyltransferase